MSSISQAFVEALAPSPGSKDNAKSLAVFLLTSPIIKYILKEKRSGQLTSTKIALVTGAAGGLGRAFARELANQGYRLILVDKNLDNLAKTSLDITQMGKAEAKTYVADLSKEEDLLKIERVIRSLDSLDVLINAAGFGTKGNFVEVKYEKSIAMLNVHAVSTTRFTHAALPGMISRKGGSIINVASAAAFLYCATWAVYNASKVYVVSFTKCLHYELVNTGVRVQALCPGMMRTGFHYTDEFKANNTFNKVPGFIWKTPEYVARKSLKALSRNKVIYTPGIIPKIVWGIFRPITASVSAQLNK